VGQGWGRRVTKEKPGFWTRQRAFEQVRHGSNIQLLSFSLVCRWPVVWAVLISLSPPSAGGSGRVGASGWPISVKGRQATTAGAWGLAGANGTWLVSMCQMASASLRATSTRATTGPRWRPSRCLMRCGRRGRRSSAPRRRWSRPTARAAQPGQQRSTTWAEQVRGRTWPPKGQQGGMHPVLERDPVADQVQPEPGPLGQHQCVDAVGLAGQRGQPLTFWASAIWTSQPASSSWRITSCEVSPDLEVPTL
jgi:hypothetical protein